MRRRTSNRSIIEQLENRLFLSSYSLSTITSFSSAPPSWANTAAEDAQSGFLIDSKGDLFGENPQAGIDDCGSIFEIVAGTSSMVTLASLNGGSANAPGNGSDPEGGLLIDSSGNLWGTCVGGGNGHGSIFELTRSGSSYSNTLQTIALFSDYNSGDGLVMDSNGNLYGNTVWGGADSDGYIWKLASGSSTVTSLAVFNYNNGQVPNELFMDSKGDIFGTTEAAGLWLTPYSSWSNGSVFEITAASLKTASPTITAIAGFHASTTGSLPFGALSMDSKGDLFGTTTNGGAGSDGTIWEITAGNIASGNPSNSIIVLLALNGSNGATPWGAPFMDSSGNLWGTTRLGGSSSDGVVFEITAANVQSGNPTNSSTTIVNFNGGLNGATPSAGFVADSSGNLYSTTTTAGLSSSGTVYAITQGAPPPPPNTATINTNNYQHSDNPNLIGVNLVYWDSQMSTAETQQLVEQAGLTIFRFPGGSSSDDYHFNQSTNNGDVAANTVPQFAQFISAVGGTGMVTIDYGSGSPQEAAAELAYLEGSPSDTTTLGTGIEWNDNTSQWQTVNWQTVGYWASLRAASSLPQGYPSNLSFLCMDHSAPFSNIKYWEVGNEEYGSWEIDHHGTNAPGNVSTGTQHDPTTYAAFAAQFATLASEITTTAGIAPISIGIDSGDPTGASDNNWTKNVLTAGNNDGFIPSFISDHNYVQAPGSESDATLLNGTVTDPSTGFDWTTRYADYETVLTQVLGSNASKVKVMATEFNSVYSNPGKQTTSLVNGLFIAESIGSLLDSGYSAGLVWDLRNSFQGSNNNSSSLYGWRQGGDYGLLGDPNNTSNAPTTGPYVEYPSYFGEQIASEMIQPGGQVLSVNNTDPYLSIYSVKEADGNVDLMVINTSPSANQTETFDLQNFTGGDQAQIWQYGETQDTAQSHSSTGASALAHSIATIPLTSGSFDYTFPVYSMTVIDLGKVNQLTLAHAAAANPNPVTATTTALSAQGSENGSGANLTYTWSLLSGPNGASAPTFSLNGSNAAQNTTATFHEAGTYNFKVVISDGTNQITSSVKVTVNQTVRSINVSPLTPTVTAGQTKQFNATALDQFGKTITGLTYQWTVGGTHNSINSSGLATVDTAGTYNLTAAIGNVHGQTTITVKVAAPDQLVFTHQPSSGELGNSPGNVTVSVEDAYGNLESTDSSTVTLTLGGTGTLSGTATVAVVNGVANFVQLMVAPTGTFTLVAVDGQDHLTNGAVSNSFAISAAPTEVAFHNQPTTTSAGGKFGALVWIEDTFGNLVGDVSNSITLVLENAPSGVSLGGTLIVAATNGVASFGNLSLTKPGTYTLEAVASGLNAATSADFVIVAGPAAHLVFTTIPINATAGAMETVSVQLTDAYGNIATGDGSTVTLGLIGGNFSGTHGLKIVNGVATFSNLSITKAGTYTITATDAGDSLSATSGSFVITPAAPQRIVFLTQPTGTAQNATLSPVTIAIEDTYGNIETADNTQVSLSLIPSTVTLQGTTVVDANHGIATFAALSINQAGTYRLHATDGSLAPANSTPLIINAPAPTQLAFGSQPTGTTAGATLGPITVKIEDSLGNTVAGNQSIVTLTLASAPATVSLTLTAQATNGIATFSNLSITKAGTYTLTANDTGDSLSATTSGSFVITPAAPQHLVFLTQPTGTAQNATLSPVTIAIEDTYGNIETADNTQVSLSLVPSSVTLQGKTVVYANHGIATFAALSINQAGTYRLHATEGSLAPANSTTLIINAPAPTQLAFGSQPTSTTAGATLAPVTVKIEDSLGNTVAGNQSIVTLTLASAPATVSLSLTAQATNGTATFSGLNFTVAGTYSFKAADGALTSVTSNAFTIGAAAATQLKFISVPKSVFADPILPAVQVAAEDAYGNIVTNYQQVISIPDTNGSLTGTLSATPVNGVATFANLNLHTIGANTLVTTDAGLQSDTAQVQFAFVLQKSLFNGTTLSAAQILMEELILEGQM